MTYKEEFKEICSPEQKKRLEKSERLFQLQNLTKPPKSVKSFHEIKKVLGMNNKELESLLNTKIRNGQHTKGIKEALNWVIS